MATLDTVPLGAGPFRLSVEELAYLCGQVDAGDVGREYLQVTFGERLTAEEARERLIAAGHGLLARELLVPRGAEPPVVAPDLEGVIRVIARPDASVRLTRSTDQPGSGVTLHLQGGRIVEQRLQYAIVHVVTGFAHQTVAIDDLAADLGVPAIATHEQPPVWVAKPTLDRAMAAWSGPDEPPGSALAAQFQADDAPPTLVDDLLAPVERATVVRIDYHDGAPATADCGVLLLRGQLRYWLLEPDAEGSTAQPATQERFRAALTVLLAGRPPAPVEAH